MGTTSIKSFMSNQINVNQCIPIIYNHMNIITIKYIQNHTSSIN